MAIKYVIEMSAYPHEIDLKNIIDEMTPPSTRKNAQARQRLPRTQCPHPGMSDRVAALAGEIFNLELDG